jgi:hypothetical protein
MDRALPWALGAVVTVVGFVGRLWVRNGAEPLQWNDSADYLTAASEPWWALERLAGPRPVLLPLVLSVVGSDLSTLVLVQAAVAAVAWGALVVAVASTLAPWWRPLVASGVLALGSLSWPLSMWDQQVLTESLALSTLVLVIAAAVALARRPGAPWPCVALVLTALGWLLARDSHVVPVALAGTAVAVLAWRATGPRRLALALTGAYLLAWCLLVVGAADHGGRHQLPIEHVYAVRILPYPDRLEWMAERGMPAAEALSARPEARGPTGDDAPVTVLDAGADLEPFRAWLRRSGRPMLLRFLVAHPGYLATEPLHTPERVFNNAGGIEGYRPLDQRDLPVPGVLANPPTIFVVLVGAGAASVVTGRQMLGHPLAIVGAVLALSAGPHALAVWHADGMEATRHLLVPSVQLRLGVALLVLAAATGTGPCPPARSPDHPRVRHLPGA